MQTSIDADDLSGRFTELAASHQVGGFDLIFGCDRYLPDLPSIVTGCSRYR